MAGYLARYPAIWIGDWLSGGLIGCWLAHCAGWMLGCLAGLAGLASWLSGSSFGWLPTWLSGWLASYLAGYLTE